MALRPDLKPTEARAFRAYWQDGVLDLLAGSAVLLIGVGWLAGFALAPVLVSPLALVAWPLLRQRITEPRLGRVEFGPERVFRMRHGVIAVVSLGLLLFGFFATRVLADRIPDLLRSVAPGIPAFLLALLSLSASEVLRLLRFAAYAVGFTAAGLVVAAVDAEPGWAIAAGGAIATVNGVRLLARFLREFPQLSTEIEP